MATASHRSGENTLAVTVLGAGAWGTAIAALLARNGHHVQLWARRAELANTITATNRNSAYLPGVTLPSGISATSDLEEAQRGSTIVFLAVPSRAVRPVCTQLAALGNTAALVSCVKGMELSSLKRISELIAEYLPSAQVGVLSGPNLAGEIAAQKPAATTIASSSSSLTQIVQQLLQQITFRVYTTSDVVGVEIAGALKNVIALACGINDGLQLGENSKAALITRGLAEMVRLGTELGGEMRTFHGLAGIGDLVATCSGQGSRNHWAGMQIAQGATVAELEASGVTAEGILTAQAIHANPVVRTIDLPITREVHRILFTGKDPRDALASLMSRAGKAE